jgi:hypothetical protein
LDELKVLYGTLLLLISLDLVTFSLLLFLLNVFLVLTLDVLLLSEQVREGAFPAEKMAVGGT